MTGVAAQNALGVTRLDALPPEAVTAKIEAVVKDMGMLLNGDRAGGGGGSGGDFGASQFGGGVMVSPTGAQLIVANLALSQDHRHQRCQKLRH